MEFRPILSALWRNRTGAVLIAMQIAFTLAVVTNASFIIFQRIDKMNRPPGLDIYNTFYFSSNGFVEDYNAKAVREADLRLLRGHPDVVAVTTINAIPLSGSGWSGSVRLSPEEGAPQEYTGYQFVNEQGVDALGVKIIEGRNFAASDVIERDFEVDHFEDVVLMTKPLADKLFPDGDALGKTVWLDNGKVEVQIAGIIEHMQGYWINWSRLDYNIFRPEVFKDNYTRYLIRTKPGQRDRVMAEIEEQVRAVPDRDRVISEFRTVESRRDRSYQEDFAMSVILAVVIGLLTAIAALGIVGLAAYTVNQRVKQIGTRRALGARKFDIIRYFVLENWAVTTAGVVVGVLLATGLNYWLVTAYELEVMAWFYVPLGILSLWGIGLAAVLGPARRASKVSPAIATRTV